MLRRFVFALVLAGLCARFSAAAPLAPTNFVNEIKVTGGLNSPVAMAFLPDGRLLIVEQATHAVKLWTGNLAPATILTVPNVWSDYEAGVLGIAVDPRWPAKPYLYVHYDYLAYPDSDVRISRFTCAGDLAFTGGGALTVDPASRRDVLTGNRDVFPQHGGGTLRFAPDGMLCASFGEDRDPCAAQDSTNLNGKIVRMDLALVPDGPGPAPPKASLVPADNPFASHPNVNVRLVYALGLRNPFRFDIDRFTGDLMIGDVGETRSEEVDYLPSGGAGLDFGWPWYEGFDTLSGCIGGAMSGFTAPVIVYSHGGGVAAIVSAGVYRRNGGASQFPIDYEGNYFYTDYYTGKLYRLVKSGAVWQVPAPVPGQPAADAWGTGFARAADWAVGPDGALWWCDQLNQRINRIRYTGPAGVELAPEPGAVSDAHGVYDLQGRRVENPEQSGLYFSRTGKKRVLLR